MFGFRRCTLPLSSFTDSSQFFLFTDKKVLFESTERLWKQKILKNDSLKLSVFISFPQNKYKHIRVKRSIFWGNFIYFLKIMNAESQAEAFQSDPILSQLTQTTAIRYSGCLYGQEAERRQNLLHSCNNGRLHIVSFTFSNLK